MLNRKIFTSWWPLALSWLLMAFELPAITIVISRLPEAETNLAAYGGLAFPLAMLIEAPIIMLLTAATELVRNRGTFHSVYRYMMYLGAGLTAVHLLCSVSPCFDLIMSFCFSAPRDLYHPTQLAMIALTPWTWSIAYRRFYQGVLIRTGHTRVISIGTAVRLLAGGMALGAALIWPIVTGACVAGMAASLGVLAEAAFIGFYGRRIVNTEWQAEESNSVATSAIHVKDFARFYLPLILTSLLLFLVQPLGSVAMSHMNRPLESLAIWPVVAGLLFIFRSFGTSFSEVVITYYKPGVMATTLRRFSLAIGTGACVILLLIASSSNSLMILGALFKLRPELLLLTRLSLVLASVTSALAAFISYSQGIIVANRKTAIISKAVLVNLVVVATILAVAMSYYSGPGIIAVTIAYSAGMVMQYAYLNCFARKMERAAAL